MKIFSTHHLELFQDFFRHKSESDTDLCIASKFVKQEDPPQITVLHALDLSVCRRGWGIGLGFVGCFFFFFKLAGSETFRICCTKLNIIYCALQMKGLLDLSSPPQWPCFLGTNRDREWSYLWIGAVKALTLVQKYLKHQGQTASFVCMMRRG